VAARWFGQERGACRCTMQWRCGGRELDNHAEAGDLAVALEARLDDRAVEKGGPDAWATAGPRAIHSWRQGGTAWSLLVPREKPTVVMRQRRPSWRETAMASGWRRR
jgi:hypothetical protein